MCRKNKEYFLIYITIHTIHLLSAFLYGGFLMTDYLFLSRMQNSLDNEEYTKARSAFMIYVRNVIPYSLFVAVGTGLYLIHTLFGSIAPEGLSYFQSILALKAFLGLWLGIRGFNQKILKIDPWIFKSHTLPFYLVILIVILSQFMYL